MLAVVLAFGGHREAVPVLLERYRAPVDAHERAAAAEALARLTGGTPRPRPTGRPGEIARAADAGEAWYRAQGELARETAREKGATDG